MANTTYTITLNEAQQKAFAHVVGDPAEWIKNFVELRCSKATDMIYTAEVARMTEDPSITSIPADKSVVVLAADIQTAAEINAALEASMIPE